MQAGTTSPRPRVSEFTVWLLLFAAIGFLALLALSFALETKPEQRGGSVATGAPGRIAYFEFGLSTDTLWLVDTANPGQRERMLSVPHAREFGAVPSLAPDGRGLVYAVIPASNPAPAPDSPAHLWLTAIGRGAEPKLIASTVDLRVPAVWSPDGRSVVFRRSDAAGYSLAVLPVAGGEERILAHSDADDALFPVAFSPDGGWFYLVAIRAGGSYLVSVEVASGVQTEVTRLSPGLTREWSLSLDGRRLAFLAIGQTAGELSSRAFVLDLAALDLDAVTPASANAFGPTWARDGSLLAGTVAANGTAAMVRYDGQTSTVIPRTTRGFDVPLGFARDGSAYLVRAFNGTSAANPGAATLTLIDAKGERHEIASGDVTFAGWSAP